MRGQEEIWLRRPRHWIRWNGEFICKLCRSEISTAAKLLSAFKRLGWPGNGRSTLLIENSRPQGNGRLEQQFTTTNQPTKAQMYKIPKKKFFYYVLNLSLFSTTSWVLFRVPDLSPTYLNCLTLQDFYFYLEHKSWWWYILIFFYQICILLWS